MQKTRKEAVEKKRGKEKKEKVRAGPPRVCVTWCEPTRLANALFYTSTLPVLCYGTTIKRNHFLDT
jgi:hypothetical protein